MSATIKTTLVNGTEVDVDVALLPVINLGKLLGPNPDAEESQKLYNAAAQFGFFYLDVRVAEQHVADIQQAYAITQKYFTQPEEVKMGDSVKDDEFRGYKPGKLFSSLEILRDDLAKNEGVPETIKFDALTLLPRFFSDCNRICDVLIQRLSDSLWPNNPSIRLGDKHLSTEPSNTSLKMYRAPALEKLADVPESKHTDGGTLTLLYSDRWGTQIQLPGDAEQWAWVQPKDGHIIVNVGNSLQAFSGGRLRSCLHRVSQVGDGFEERWVLSYFLRPQKGADLIAM